MTKIIFQDYGCLGKGWADVYIDNTLTLKHLKGQDALDIYKVLHDEQLKAHPSIEVMVINMRDFSNIGFIEK